MGHVTRDAELRYTPSGKAVTNFSLATNFGSGDNKTVEYHNCIVWDASEKAPKAQWAAKLRQGDLAYVEGRIVTRTWDDKEGNHRKNVEIVCDRADLLRSKLGEGAGNKASQFDLNNVDPDDIPF